MISKTSLAVIMGFMASICFASTKPNDMTLSSDEYDVAIGNHAQVHGKYNVVIGANRSILHGECRMSLGRLDWQVREVLMFLHDPKPKYTGGPVPNIGKIVGPTFDAIDKHCGYKPGTVSSYVTKSYYTGSAK